jgi:hypothetical protein
VGRTQQRLTRDREEIDENARRQERIDLRASRLVAAGKANHRRFLIIRVVIDVHCRRRFPARDDEVDERLERALFFHPVVAPEPEKPRPVAIALAQRHPEQVLQAPAAAKKRVAFHVEKAVCGIGCGQEREAAPRPGIEEVVR